MARNEPGSTYPFGAETVMKPTLTKTAVQVDDEAPFGSHRLKSLTVIGGFLDGVIFDLSEGLNCIIGARGTGKTTVLEQVRFALDALPVHDEDPDERRRIESLIAQNLAGGRVELTIETKDGLTYTVTRTEGEDPIILDADGHATELTLGNGGLFSADIYSQNEVERIADRSLSQLNLIDNFKAQRADGRFIPSRGTDMAKRFKGGKATENTVSSCVNDLRSRITKAMAGRGLKCGKQDVIASGGPGYRLKEWIKVEERDENVAGTCGDRDMSDVPAPRPNVPATSANVPLNNRQHWVLEQLRAGIELQRQDIEKHFRVTEKTAKRDLSDLVGRGLIAFERTPRPGHYRLAKRSQSGRPADKILENRDLQRGLAERIHEPV